MQYAHVNQRRQRGFPAVIGMLRAFHRANKLYLIVYSSNAFVLKVNAGICPLYLFIHCEKSQE